MRVEKKRQWDFHCMPNTKIYAGRIREFGMKKKIVKTKPREKCRYVSVCFHAGEKFLSSQAVEASGKKGEAQWISLLGNFVFLYQRCSSKGRLLFQPRQSKRGQIYPPAWNNLKQWGRGGRNRTEIHKTMVFKRVGIRQWTPEVPGRWETVRLSPTIA